MPHLLTLADDTFSRLQALAKPFVDTPESLIDSLASAELERRGISSGGNGLAPEETDRLLLQNPDAHDDLAHARLVSAMVDGLPIHRPKWNGVLNYCHILARKRLGSFEAVRRVSGAHLRNGKYEESGFKYLPEADLSIQGVDSNLAWDHSLGLARELRIPIELRFEWRHKEGAAHPGEKGILQWSPMG